MRHIKGLYIDCTSCITKALKQMDSSMRKLLIVREGKTYIGLLSIGDIQRAIIKGISLDTTITKIMRSSHRVASDKDSLQSIKETMLRYRTECMPILNSKGELSNVYFWEDIFKGKTPHRKTNLKLPVVIMAGGKGARLRPITNILPKALIPTGEKTIIEEIMDNFTKAGCSDFLLSVNYKADMIKHYFDSINNSNYNIDYFQEDKPLGTAGSMHLIKNKISSTFFVSNCDILIDQDLGDIYKYHKKNNNIITIVSALKHYKIPYGTIETGENGQLKRLSEKPELTYQINAGLYILEPECLEYIPENKFYHITDLIEELKHEHKIGVFPISEGSWRDIGEWPEYLKTINVHK